MASAFATDMKAGLWAVGFGFGGAIVGVAIDSYIYPWIQKTFKAESFLHDNIGIEHALTVGLDVALGIILLGSLAKYVIPAGTEIEIGDSVLTFFFFASQPQLLRGIFNLVAHYIGPKPKAMAALRPAGVTTGPNQPMAALVPAAPAQNPPAPLPKADAEDTSSFVPDLGGWESMTPSKKKY